MAILGLSGRAQAAPSSTPPYASSSPAGQNITINLTVVNIGGTVNVTVIGAVSGHNINFYIHSAEVYLASARANSNGEASAALKLPSGFTGRHTIVAKVPPNGQTWNIGLTIVSAAAAGSATSSASSGGLPNTGAAVMGLGVLVLILLSGGAMLLVLGRRRVRSSH